MLKEKLFDNVGKKIRKISIYGFYTGSVLFVIAALAIWVAAENSFWIGMAVLAGGVLLFWLTSLCGYAFGELVQNTADMNRRMSVLINRIQPGTEKNPAPEETIEKKDRPQAVYDHNEASYAAGASERNKSIPDDNWVCPNCGKSNYRYNSRCSCGTKKPFPKIKS